MVVLVTMFFALFGLVNGAFDIEFNTVTTVDLKNNYFEIQIEKGQAGFMFANLWGAGGAGGVYKKNETSGFAGGGGAFVSCFLQVKENDVVRFRVGRGGRASNYNKNSNNVDDQSAGMSQSSRE
jgi:hypothetical protein